MNRSDDKGDAFEQFTAQQEEGGLLPDKAQESIARLFAERHEGDLRYVGSLGRWYWFDGGRWREDTTKRAFWHARKLCYEVATGGDWTENVRCSIASWGTVQAVEKLARADTRLTLDQEQFDASDWLLNVGEGLTAREMDAMPGLVAATVDLISGTDKTPSPLDYLTKRAACRCAPKGTEDPLWSRFLARITNHDPDLVAFLQRWCGYCLTGNTREHKLVFLYGRGANGKSTFVATVAGILADYAVTADTSSFVVTTGDQHPTDLARLRGARLVTAQETSEGRRWNESRIKQLTGGDPISARFMRQDFFEFTPRFKLMISGNHKPRLSNIDEAIRRRLLLVPFTVAIPEAERDPDLPAKLRTEWPAILRWMIDGCAEWQRVGLSPPAAVRDATEEYFAAEDTVGQWFEECIIDGGDAAFTRTKNIFSSWKLWCEDRNLRPGSERRLSDRLVGRGYKRVRNSVGQWGFRRLCAKK
jgi:putative DNA primase/helicase